MSKILAALNEQKRQIIKDLLAQCTEPQVDLFKRMYRHVDIIPDDKLEQVIRQCEATVEKNKIPYTWE